MIAIENCIRNVRAWMREDKLMLNDDKTELDHWHGKTVVEGVR